MVLLCCEANCSSTTDSLAVLGDGGVGGGRGVAAPGSGTTEGVGRGEGKGCVEEGEENINCIPSHFTCISDSENGMPTTISGGTSNVCRGLHPHMQVHMLYFSLTHL